MSTDHDKSERQFVGILAVLFAMLISVVPIAFYNNEYADYQYIASNYEQHSYTITYWSLDDGVQNLILNNTIITSITDKHVYAVGKTIVMYSDGVNAVQNLPPYPLAVVVVMLTCGIMACVLCVLGILVYLSNESPGKTK